MESSNPVSYPYVTPDVVSNYQSAVQETHRPPWASRTGLRGTYIQVSFPSLQPKYLLLEFLPLLHTDSNKKAFHTACHERVEVFFASLPQQSLVPGNAADRLLLPLLLCMLTLLAPGISAHGASSFLNPKPGIQLQMKPLPALGEI